MKREIMDHGKLDGWPRDVSLLLAQLGTRLKRDPVGTFKRGLYHLTIGRYRYAKGGGYDARRFWRDRFERCGFSFASVTDEGFSDAENRERYQIAKEKFLECCKSQDIDFGSASAMEIGCGTGFYSQTLHELGLAQYTGVDITDTLFPALSEAYPSYNFTKKDVTTEALQGSYDLILMIDVVQHVVSESKLRFAMENVKRCLADNGVFMIAPLCESSRRAPFLYFLRMWSLDDITKHFEEYTVSEPALFRGKDSIIAIRI